MKTSSRILSLLLCLCLALSLLAGCGSPSPAPASQTATPAPTPEPTPEPLDAPALYREAAQKIQAAPDLELRYTISQEVLLPDFAAEEPGGTVTLSEKTNRTARYRGLDGEALQAVVEDVIVQGDNPRIDQKLCYSEGVAYLDLKGAKYCAEQEQKDFLAGQLPILLLDPALYGEAAGEETEAGIALRFAAPSAGETWALPEDAELLEAEGHARLSPEGDLTGADYALSYIFGGATVKLSYELSYRVPEALDLTQELPAGPKGWESLDDLTAPLAFLRAGQIMAAATAAGVDLNFNYYSEAAGYSVRYFQDEDMLDRGGSLLYHGKYSVSGVDYSRGQARTFAYSYEEDFAPGTLTTSYDDGSTETEPMSSDEIRFYFTRDLTQYFPAFDQLKDAEGKDVGAYRLIRFAGTDAYGEAVKNEVGGDLFDPPTVLDDNATSYATTGLTGYLAVEKVTGIPTAFALDYAGTHTIEGMPFALRMTLNMGLSLYTDEAPRSLFDGVLPDGPEPETRPSPVFYQVSDAEGHILYLLGTIHIGDDRTAYLPQAIYDAFEASDALAVEFDTDRFEDSIGEDAELLQTLMQAYYYTDGTSIQNHLDSDVYKQALDYIQVAGAYTDTAERMKPSLWENGLEQFYLSQGRSLTGAKGVDNRLMRLAREAGKEILDVESGEFQVGILTGWSDPVQELMLQELLETSRGEYLRSSREIYEAWCEGDEAALIERLAAMTEDERAELDEDELAIYDEYHQKMEVERNAAMVEVAKGYLAEGRTVFFAVGLAHLLGEGGLVQALRDAGYTVDLIDTH